LLPNVVCSSVIQGDTQTPNFLNKQTKLTRDADDKLYVDGAQIITSDVMATNGVLYIIDDVLIPDEGISNIMGYKLLHIYTKHDQYFIYKILSKFVFKIS
jgi:transforming growth factor-beta-induced protein